jgi:hypothetical protein
MKNTIKLFKIIAIAAVILFTMTACEEETPGEETLTYKGTSGGTEWVLKITGGSYELQKGMTGGGGFTGMGAPSTGTVIEKKGTTYYLKPNIAPTVFTATVTSNGGLVDLSGTIVWYAGGSQETLPGQLTPSGGTGSGGGYAPPTQLPESGGPGSGDEGEW